ncbi:MAG TPA: DUF4340 domain-containing protein [Syntrophaceae bacterium]|nr:DUF4340 domain-containing protein [Syntrophaceae bacterium]
MGYKRTYMVVATLVVLVLVIFLLERPFREKGKETLLFEGFQPKDVTKIETRSGNQKITLEKAGDLWLVGGKEGYKADSSAIQDILHTMERLNRRDLVSKNPKKREVYEVNEKDGAEVKVYDNRGKLMAHLFLGKGGPDLFSTYIRRADENEVYLVEGYLKTTFIRSQEDWRDKTIFDFDPQHIHRIILESGGKRIVVEREDVGEWKLKRPQEQPADKGKLEDMIYTLATLKASRFPEEGEPKGYDWNNPKARVTAILKDGGKRTLLIGSEEKGGGVYVKRQGEETIFMVPKYVVAKFVTSPGELKEKEVLRENGT